MASESVIHAFLLFLGLFSNFPFGCACYTPCIFFADITKGSGKNSKICQLIYLVFDTIYKRRNHKKNMASGLKNFVENKR